MKFQDSIIFNPNALEIHAVNHCNLTCRFCSHSSPRFQVSEVSPLELGTSLSILSRCYKAEYCNILGGEPFLHTSLDKLLEIIRKSNISNKIKIITNGSIISRKWNTRLNNEVDEIEISIYPAMSKNLPQIFSWITDTLNFSSRTRITVYYYHSFRVAHIYSPRQDKQTTLDIFNSCKLINHWFCHNIYNGYFFKCPQSCFSNLDNQSNPNQSWKNNGIKISNRANFYRELLRYLKSTVPLPYCSKCLGSVGIIQTHKQTKKNEWTTESFSQKNVIDYKFLHKLLNDISISDGCGFLLYDSDLH